MARAFLRDSAGLAASQYVARAMLLARGLAAAAALGPLGFGAWNALNLILDYGAYASLGAFHGLDLALPAMAARGEAGAARRAMSGAWAVALLGGAAFVLAVTAALRGGAWVAETGWGWQAPALMLGAAMLQLAVLYQVSALRARHEFRAISVGLALQSVIGGGIGLASVWRAGVWGLLWGWLVGGLCAIAWMRRSPGRPPWGPAHLREGATLAASGLPMFAFFGVALLVRSIDRIALARFGTNQTLGYYGLGLTATTLVLYIPEAAAAVLLPRIASAAGGAGDVEAARRTVLRAHRALMVGLPALIGPAVAWAPFFLARLLPAYAPSFAPLRILSIAALVNAMSTVPVYFLLGFGQARSLLALAAAVALAAAAIVLGVASATPQAVDVAWAATLGYAVFSFAMLAQATPRLAPAVADRAALWFATIVPSAWAILLMMLLSRTPDPSLLGAGWRTLAFLVAYAPVAWRFGRAIRRPSVPG